MSPGESSVRSGRRERADLRPEHWYLLPDSLRRELALPFGPVVAGEALASALGPKDMLIAVGDVVSLSLKKLNITPRIFICDFQTQRGDWDPLYEAELGAWGEVSFQVYNAAGTISRGAWDAVRSALNYEPYPVRIVVDGEEDLLGIPCFLEAPVGTRVLYGIPGKGVAIVDVTEAFQERVASLLARFIKE